MAKRSDGCSSETLLTPCAKKKRDVRSMTKDYYYQVLKKILACSVRRQVNVIGLFNSHCLKDQLGLCSILFHTYAITERSK